MSKIKVGYINGKEFGVVTAKPRKITRFDSNTEKLFRMSKIVKKEKTREGTLFYTITPRGKKIKFSKTKLENGDALFFRAGSFK